MDILAVCGTEEKRELSEFVQDHIEGAWLLAIEHSQGDRALEAAGERSVTARQFERSLEESDIFPRQGTLILETNYEIEGLETALRVLVVDGSPGELDERVVTAGDGAHMVIVVLKESLKGAAGLGLERAFKSKLGAKKVLICADEESKARAFSKVVDVYLSRTGGMEMAEEVPDDVIEAVKAEAREGKITCARAHLIAAELEVAVPVVGRALDLLGIKISRCQLGCF